MNRKGDVVSITPVELAYLVIGLVVIGGLIYSVTLIIEAVSNKPDEATLNSFDGLVTAINGLSENNRAEINVDAGKITFADEKGNTIITAAYYLQNNYGLLGFDGDNLAQNCGVIPGISVTLPRPVQCLQKSCLCLAKLGTTKVVASYERCKVLNNINSIFATTNTEQYGNYGKPRSNGLNLAIWDGCWKGSTFKTKTFKITVFKAQDKTALQFDILNPTAAK